MWVRCRRHAAQGLLDCRSGWRRHFPTGGGRYFKAGKAVGKRSQTLAHCVRDARSAVIPCLSWIAFELPREELLLRHPPIVLVEDQATFETAQENGEVIFRERSVRS